ncbi:MAG: acyl-CoA dehydrogenase family protein, partial [Aeromonas veronii]
MDFTLTDDQQAYVEAAAAFADEALKPHAARWDKEHEFPIPTIKQAAGLGFCGLYTPEQFGGLGLPRLDASLIFERLAMGCTSTTAYLTIHNMVSWMLGSWLPTEVAKEWVP